MSNTNSSADPMSMDDTATLIAGMEAITTPLIPPGQAMFMNPSDMDLKMSISRPEWPKKDLVPLRVHHDFFRGPFSGMGIPKHVLVNSWCDSTPTHEYAPLRSNPLIIAVAVATIISVVCCL